MRILDRYIGIQVLTGTLYAVFVLGLVLVLGNLFKQIQPLLVDQKAPLELVLRFVLSILPLSLMFTIPWGFLSAVLLVFSRLSNNQEITSMRVAGISLVRIAMPVFIIGALLSLFSLWININVVPHSKATSFKLLYEQAKRDPESILKPGVAQGKLGESEDSTLKLLIEGRDNDWVHGFNFYQIPKKLDKNDITYVHAQKASLHIDEANSKLLIKLDNAFFETQKQDGSLETAFAGRAEPLLIDLKSKKQKKMKANAMTNEEILDTVKNSQDLPESLKVRMLSEITRRYSFSFACFSFAFIAVPLGLTKRRKDTSGGLVLSLFIGAGYFVLTILANQFKTQSGATAMLWAPNVLCILLGIFLFYRAKYK